MVDRPERIPMDAAAAVGSAPWDRRGVVLAASVPHTPGPLHFFNSGFLDPHRVHPRPNGQGSVLPRCRGVGKESQISDLKLALHRNRYTPAGPSSHRISEGKEARWTILSLPPYWHKEATLRNSHALVVATPGA